jgi:hypothetical protein
MTTKFENLYFNLVYKKFDKSFVFEYYNGFFI